MLCGGRHSAKIHAAVKLSNGFNVVDPRNVRTEVGLVAIRAERENEIDKNFMKAVGKENKKLETKPV